MFLGHYAFGFYLKKKSPETPLWVILLSVQLVDLLWAVFLLVGVERASYNPEASVFLRAIYEYYPYTHSLLSALILSAFGWFVARGFGGKKTAIVVALALLSHWFLDVLVHAPDLPLFLDSFKVGFSLWAYPTLTLILEISLLSAGVWYFLRGGENKRTRIWIGSLYAFLTLFYVMSFFAPAIAPSPFQIGVFGVLVYGGVALWAYLAERHSHRSGDYTPSAPPHSSEQ